MKEPWFKLRSDFAGLSVKLLVILAGFSPFLCRAQSSGQNKARLVKTGRSVARQRGHFSALGKAHVSSCLSFTGRLCSLGIDSSCVSNQEDPNQPAQQASGWLDFVLQTMTGEEGHTFSVSGTFFETQATRDKFTCSSSNINQHAASFVTWWHHKHCDCPCCTAIWTLTL